MSLTEKYQGNTVDAVQLTRENIEAVAAWCGGKVSIKSVHVEQLTAESPVSEEKVRLYITPHRPNAWRFGTIGDWVVKDEADGVVRLFAKNIFPKIFKRSVSISVAKLDSVSISVAKLDDAKAGLVKSNLREELDLIKS